MIKELHIYDIDGVLVDSSHRYRYIIGADGWRAIDLPYWIANRKHAKRDRLLPLAKQYQAQNSDPSIFTVLATARVMTPAEWRHVETVLTMPDHFISRTEGNTESGAALKTKGLNILFEAIPDLLTVPGYFYEDNITYLNNVCETFNFSPLYLTSKQGY